MPRPVAGAYDRDPRERRVWATTLDRVGQGRASVGLDLPKAIRAVNRAIHARLEWNLRLVAARRADHREIFTGDVIVATLVAARAANITDVVARFASRPPARSAAGAALRVGSEAFLDVVLLVGGRMDEFHPAVDTGQRSVDVGHENVLSSGAIVARALGRPLRQTGRCGCVGKVRRRYPGAVMESLFRAHRLFDGGTIHRCLETGVAAVVVRVAGPPESNRRALPSRERSRFRNG
jgi:hypothetical protein